MAVHKPLVVAVNVSHDIRVVMHNAEQIGGDVTIEIMGKNQVAVRVMYARTVRGDHVRLDLQVIADLPHVHVVAASGEHEVHATGSQEF
ncbi:Uncharacterised protein [Enterobacter cloacae]|nr:Uncharacterised protein [Enterobacter cloacae]